MAGSTCVAGACTCDPGFTACNGVCVELQVDPANCGSCGNACPASQFCSAGICVAQCPPSQIACNGGCVDPQSDDQNCGACGVICPDEAILDTYGNITKVLKRQERPIAVVHPDNCNGCGVCIDACPFDCISPSPENHAQYLGKVTVDEKTCVGCKLCEEVCGWEGIYIMPGAEKGAFLGALGYEADSVA